MGCDDVCCDRRPFHCSSEVLSAGAVKYVLTDFARGSPATPEIKSNSPLGRSAGCRSGWGRRDRRYHHGHGAGDFQMEQSGSITATARSWPHPDRHCVRADTPMPDISTPDGFKQSAAQGPFGRLRNPQAGGTSGIFLVGLLERLGIAEAVGKKALLCINGDEVVDKVSAGDAEIGSTFLSEIVPMKAVKAVGALPPPMQNATAYAAGIMTGSSNPEAAERFIAMLTAPAQRNAWLSLGFEPTGHG